jgi:CHAT domain-containing protein
MPDPRDLFQGMYAFELALTEEPEGYRAHVTLSPTKNRAGTAVSGITIGNKGIVDEVIALRAKFRKQEAGSGDLARMQSIGKNLFREAFASGIASEFRESLKYAAEINGALRVRLKIVSGKLAASPWELLSGDPIGYLAISDETTLMRFLHPDVSFNPFETSQRKTIALPIKVLVHVCDHPPPPNFAAIDSDKEIAGIKSALAPLMDSGDVELYQTNDGSWEGLSSAIEDTTPQVDVLHLIGHGFDDDGVGKIVIGTKAPDAFISGQKLAEELKGSGIRLVVLNACKSGESLPASIFSGVAQNLVRTGIAAALAMQFSISDGSAIVFANALYSALAKNLPLDVSVSTARCEMRGQSEFEWITPVFYVAYPDASLFSIPPTRPNLRYRTPILSYSAEHPGSKKRTPRPQIAGDAQWC